MIPEMMQNLSEMLLYQAKGESMTPPASFSAWLSRQSQRNLETKQNPDLAVLPHEEMWLCGLRSPSGQT